MVKVGLDNISDNKVFQDLALLIDREDVQRRLKKLKKEHAKEYLGLADYLLNSKELDIARGILRRYKYPFGFTRAVIAACTGKVIDSDIKGCYSKTLTIPNSLEFNYPITKEEIVIAIYPFTIKGRKKELLKEIGKTLTNVIKLFKPLPKNHPLNLDVKPSIREARDWYWEKKLNKTKTIVKKLADNRRFVAENTISKAISNYSKLLSSEF